MTTYPRTFRQSSERVKPVSKPETLLAHRTLSVARYGQTLRVISGTAWITMDCRDFVLHPGDTIRLKHGDENAVLEAMCHEHLVYEWL